MIRRFATVRARLTIGAVAVVALTLLAGAFGFVALLRAALTENVTDSTEARAYEVAALAQLSDLPPSFSSATTDESVAQVVDEQGRVLAASAALAGAPPIASLETAVGERRATTVRIAALDNDPFRVVALGVSGPSGPVTVYAAGSLDGVGESVAVVVRILAVGLPLLLVVVGLTTRAVATRALRPVEAIRARVAELSHRSLDQHVPEPAGDDEIARLARTMNEMLDRLRVATERQRRFVGDASHELMSPLASCRAELEVALAAVEDADWPTTAANVLEEQERMERLVRDLLLLARLDENAARTETEAVDLDDIVLAEAGRLRERGRVQVDSSEVSGVEVHGHADELRRVVRNLADNAERHARATVSFSLRRSDDQARLVVSDDGPGIPRADRARVFERFTRLDDSRTRETGGVGLGLAIVHDVVVAHHGTVTVEDGTPGTRLVVTLPVDE